MNFARPIGGQVAMVEFPPPLDPVRLDEIKALIAESGGVVPLGKICHNFLGVKRAQLEGHFMMHRVGDQWQVQNLDGLDMGTLLPHEVARQAARCLPTPPRVSSATRISTQPTGSSLQNNADVPPLDAETGEAVARLLEEAGGVLPLGHVTQKFPGLKRLQLVGFFELDRVGENGQWEVRLPGVMPSGVELMFDGRAVAKGEPLPPLDDSIVESITSALESEPEFTLPMMKILEIAPGVKRQQLEPHFEIVRVDKKRFHVRLAGSFFQPPAPPSVQAPQPLPCRSSFKPPAQPSAQAQPAFQVRAPTEEAAPLDSDTVAQVADLIVAAGGAVNLGKISSIFKFIKRSQLEGHFELERIGDQWEVRIPPGGVGTAEIPPPRQFQSCNQGSAVPPDARQQPGISNSHSHRIGVHGPGRASQGPGFGFGAVHRHGLNGGFGGGLIRPSIVPPPLHRGTPLPVQRGLNSFPALPHMQSAACGFTHASVARGKGAHHGRIAGSPANNLVSPIGTRMRGKGIQPAHVGSGLQPLEPLDPQILDQIKSLVLESSGPVPMGKVSATFMGVKRAHLEEHFGLARSGDQWVVSLSSPVKRQRVSTSL